MKLRIFLCLTAAVILCVSSFTAAGFCALQACRVCQTLEGPQHKIPSSISVSSRKIILSETPAPIVFQGKFVLQ